MKTNDFFPEVAGGGPRWEVEKWRQHEILVCGGGDADLAALAHARPGPCREVVHRFLLHYHGRDGGRIVNAFESLTEQAKARGWPERVGSDTLKGAARMSFEGVGLNNDLAPCYVIALRIKRPDLAPYLEIEAPAARALLAAGWKPAE